MFVNIKKEDFIDFYVIVKKIINSLKKFINICKFKLKKNKITTDLYLRPLSEYKECDKIKLLIDNTIYEFALNNIKRLWVKKLKFSDGLFIAPDNLKNPYTNVYIKPHNLYNIYFKLRYNNKHIPSILTLLFECDMNCTKLSVLHYPIIKGYAIENFIVKGSISDLYNETVFMTLEYLTEENMLYLPHDTHVPHAIKKKIVNNLRKYITLYLFSKYSSNTIIRSSSDEKLKKLLNEYIAKNPNIELTESEKVYIHRVPEYSSYGYGLIDEIDVSSNDTLTNSELPDTDLSNESTVNTNNSRNQLQISPITNTTQSSTNTTRNVIRIHLLYLIAMLSDPITKYREHHHRNDYF